MSTMVIVRHELSKTKHKYLTFLSPEGYEYIKAYLEKRLANGENIRPDSAVVTYKSGYDETGYRGNSVREYMHIATETVTKRYGTPRGPGMTGVYMC